jgi:hypothetical protein
MHSRTTLPCHTSPQSQGSGPARNGSGWDRPTGYHASRTKSTSPTSMTSSPLLPPKNASSLNGNTTGHPSLVLITANTTPSSQTHPVLSCTLVRKECCPLGPAGFNAQSSNLPPNIALLPTTPPSSDHQPAIELIARNAENFTQHTMFLTMVIVMSQKEQKHSELEQVPSPLRPSQAARNWHASFIKTRSSYVPLTLSLQLSPQNPICDLGLGPCLPLCELYPLLPFPCCVFTL